MVEIKLESVNGNRGIIQALLPSHWDELAKNKALMVLEPDYDRYQALEEIGALFGLFAYEGGKLVGYSINVVSPHLHYKSVLCCANDLLYLSPEYRQGRVGLKLISETEKHAKKLGCNLLMWHAKKDTALEAILPKIGCKVQEIMFSKEL